MKLGKQFLNNFSEFFSPWTDTNQKLCTEACPVTPVATLLPRAAAASETGESSFLEAASEIESSNCDANALEIALNDSEIHNAEMSCDFFPCLFGLSC